jgi:hypothetical protein
MTYRKIQATTNWKGKHWTAPSGEVAAEEFMDRSIIIIIITVL